MRSKFETLPLEVIEMFVKCLELNDVGSLRLTNRAMKEKVSKGRFLTFFARKNVMLTTRTLQNMVEVTRQGHLGCRLQHCTITGIASKDTKTKEEEDIHSRLLSEAFTNLKQNSDTGAIASLYLTVTIDRTKGRSDKWWLIWAAAESTFNIVMPALCESQLQVDEDLDIFGSVRSRSLNCKLFQDFVRNVTATNYLFYSLKKLSLSLSVRCQDTEKSVHELDDAMDLREDSWPGANDPSPFNVEDADQLTNSKASLQCIPSLLRNMPELESFDLRWYSLGMDTYGRESHDTKQRKPHQNVLPLVKPLKNCTLHGMFISEIPLLEFLDIVRPSKLTLLFSNIAYEDTCDRLFEYLTNPDSPINEYHLDDLFVGNHRVCYETMPGKSKSESRIKEGPCGPTILTRLSQDARDVIKYRFDNSRPPSMEKYNAWAEERRATYGPPNTRSYDFIGSNVRFGNVRPLG